MDAEVFARSPSSPGREPDPLHDRDRADAPHRVRKFGWVALAAAPALWAVARHLWHAPRTGLWIGGIVLAWGILSILAPGPSAPLLRGWILVTKPIGAVTTTVILAIVYYAVLTPLALLRRIGNRDPLDEAWDPARGASGWRAKRLPPPDSDRWYRPY